MCSRCDFRYVLSVWQAMALIFAGWLWGNERRADLIEANDSLFNENDRLRDENRHYRGLLGELAVENLNLHFGIVIGPNTTIKVDEPRDASDEILLEEPGLRPWCCLPSYASMLSPVPNRRCDCHAWYWQPQFRQQNRCYGHSTLDAGTLSD